jgi:hypothetical protein
MRHIRYAQSTEKRKPRTNLVDCESVVFASLDNLGGFLFRELVLDPPGNARSSTPRFITMEMLVNGKKPKKTR